MGQKIKKIKKPNNFMTLVQSGDDILDYKQAVKYFSGGQIDITYGGNHSYENFESNLIKIQKFLNLH
jgi:hypothetical protein